MTCSFKAVIPARYASTRLPAKPLLDLGGKPMVVRVAERAVQSGAEEVLVAVDHPDVLAAVKSHGYSAIMTRIDHPTGTDRIAEVVAQCGWGDDTLVVNVQGDEPMIDPALVAMVAQRLADSNAAIATVGHPIHDLCEFLNSNVVKVVRRADGDAMYFSRAPIPWPRDAFSGMPGENGRLPSPGRLPPEIEVLRHIGLYAYRAGFLKAYASLAPSPLERVEALEQLRALHHGYRINVLVCDIAPVHGVDTSEDALRMQKVFAGVESYGQEM